MCSPLGFSGCCFVNVKRLPSFPNRVRVVNTLVYLAFTSGHYYIGSLMIRYLSRCGVFCSRADSHFRLVPAEAALFRLCVAADTFDRMVTHCAIPLVYIVSRIFFILQHGHS